VERRDQIGFAGKFEVETVHQFRIVAGLDANRKPTLETGNARDCPSVEGLPFEPLVLRNGQLPEVAEYYTVPGVVERKRSITAIANGFENIFEAGRTINRLAPGVRHLKLQSTRKPFLQ